MKIPRKIGLALQVSFGSAIAVAGLWIFLRGVNLQELVGQVKSFSLPLFVGVCLLSLLSLYFRALRWRIILPPTHNPPTKELFAITMIGFMMNNILPARAGEAVRAVLLWRRCRYRPFVSVGSLLVERFLDVLAFLAVFFVPVFLLGQFRPLMHLALILSGVFSVVVALLGFYSVFPAMCGTCAGYALKCVPGFLRVRVMNSAREVVSNLDFVRSPRRLVPLIGLSILIVLCQALAIVALVGDIRAFTPLHGMFVGASAALGAAIPLAPGYVGTLHAVMLQGLVAAGVVADRARVIALLYHAAGYLPITLVGLYFFFRFNIQFRDLSNAKSSLESVNSDDSDPTEASQAEA